jgi:hypothetical protein
VRPPPKPKPGAKAEPMAPEDLPAPPLALVNPDVNLNALDDEMEA